MGKFKWLSLMGPVFVISVIKENIDIAIYGWLIVSVIVISLFIVEEAKQFAKDDEGNPIIGLFKKLSKNSLIIVFILSVASLIEKGRIDIPPMAEGYPSVAYLLYLVPLFGLAFLYPFTKYGAMVFLALMIPKKYNESISIVTLTFIAHIITITIWVMVASGIISPEYTEPNSRAEQFLGL